MPVHAAEGKRARIVRIAPLSSRTKGAWRPCRI